ncbi:MAG TPA: ANTAR domain-containing protein [Streptosporangiaceae bacterium]
MVLADLLASELPAELPAGQADGTATTAPPATGQPDSGVAASQASPASRPGKAKAAAAAAGAAKAGDSGQVASQRSTEADPAGDAGRMRTTISQLEHALVARIRVEQAIGVLAERHRIQPRQAFEQLRRAARNRGKRVIDIASDVVASASNPLLQLPDELSRPRSGRRSRRSEGVLGAE